MRKVGWIAVALLAAGCGSGEPTEVEQLEERLRELEEAQASPPSGVITPPAGPGDPLPSPTPTAATGGRLQAAPTLVGEDLCRDGTQRYIVIANRATETLRYFYASPTNVDNWEEDILGEDVVMPGTTYSINFNSDNRCTCRYDTKAEFADGSVVIREVDVCEEHQQIYR